ncbi:hypothetical protein M0C34_00805 [Agarivorans sp. TSD2052]|uniref:hypothetical protein n=1 Tax=Agarivorans sp. TSD2052 TaxID=2937286 RepID=UPI00200E7CBB|nr:hypothetical protein [Agarivorans sp. TSD2052]UPW18848.1 hypothetical protein M0C34_00805 [Agarivorans sp. TSD2052]
MKSMMLRVALFFVILPLTACGNFAVIDLADSNGITDSAIENFCSDNGLVQDKKPWIRSYNRWANSPRNELLRSWSGEYEGEAVMLVELKRDGKYILVVDVQYAHERPNEVANHIVGRLKQAGVKYDIVIEYKSFLRLS